MQTVWLFFVSIAILPAFSLADETDWSIEGKALTTDNCVVGCPCLFGEEPTHGRCEYTGILVIEKGYYGTVKLDNTRIAIGGAFGRPKEEGKQQYDFIAFYIDAGASSEQRKALRQIVTSKVFEPMGNPVEIREVPISVTGIDGFGTVGRTYGGMVGDFCKIQVTPVAGAMGGKPIVVENSAEPLFHWTALGKSSDGYFKAAGMNWTFNGTSGESHKFHIRSAAGSEHKGHH